MTHPIRRDYPGSEHHVFNRGIARRTVFESKADIRHFLALLACQVRAGRIEVIAYAFMTTHYHLWLRSPKGELSEAFGWVVREYVRYFNRGRKRDGSLYRGRFGSRLVNSARYRWMLLRYIDNNAVHARLAKRPWLYPHGSAMLYGALRRPKWLSTEYVDGLLGNPAPAERLQRYAAILGAPLDPEDHDLVRRRQAAPAHSEDELDDLVNAAPPAVLRWMKRKAALADGTDVGAVVCSPLRIHREIVLAKAREEEWLCKPGGQRRVSAWPICEAALLRHLAGLGFAAIGRRIGTTRGVARTRLRQHRRLLDGDEEYARRSAELASASLCERH